MQQESTFLLHAHEQKECVFLEACAQQKVASEIGSVPDMSRYVWIYANKEISQRKYLKYGDPSCNKLEKIRLQLLPDQELPANLGLAQEKDRLFGRSSERRSSKGSSIQNSLRR